MSLTHSPSVVTNGLTLYFDAANVKSYPGSGTAWKDLTGSGVTTTLTNGPTYSSANAGSILFDGINDVANATTSIIDRADGQEITVSSWIKPARTSGQYSIVCTNRSNDASIYNWILYQHTSDGALAFHGDNQNKSSYVPTINVWINVTNTVTSTGVSTLYINGVSTFVVTGFTYGNGTPGRFGIGANPGASEAFQGNISQVSIYNRALTQAEITKNFNALRGRYGL
ncbi:Concanavalin A-like lectin/glucanases superfamily [uncultured Caudovirales phage]|uniref:Concanavalin A-like lectin/glucanases superfamily n=1 Tax=uncultured Caudovirales phage TaxID=2100421 RepID=A0A6J5NEZ3_9CAUD|nr:Concanavalin A-like lectin/glucanases superfamily [uncultured Caudovirales phage]